MATTTIWKIHNPDPIFGGYSWSMEKLNEVYEGVVATSEAVEIEIPDGFEIVKNPLGQPMFCRAGDRIGYEIVSTSRWSDKCLPLLIGGDDVDIVHLRTAKAPETD